MYILSETVRDVLQQKFALSYIRQGMTQNGVLNQAHVLLAELVKPISSRVFTMRSTWLPLCACYDNPLQKLHAPTETSCCSMFVLTIDCMEDMAAWQR